jgi:hypothetical protein
MKINQNFSLYNNDSRTDVPIVREDTKTRYNWIPVGIWAQDDFFNTLTLAYNQSTTNSACVDGISDLIFGKGLCTKDTTFENDLYKLVSQSCIKKIAFDIKLYGNAAFQVVWNDEHTKIKKFYHVPIHTLRAEKLSDSPQIEAYYYCTDWEDYKKQKEKKRFSAFGTSQDKIEILYIKEYEPVRFYYSLPDWFSAVQFADSEGELSNLHYNNISNGFLPLVMVNFNNGVPHPEERDTIEAALEDKFTHTRNAGRFMVSFNDDPTTKPTIDTIQQDNLHERYQYVAEYIQDRILVAHRIVSPLLFGIRTANNGFSSNAEEMKVAFSILQTMTIQPFQGLILTALSDALIVGGWGARDLYFEQLTPLVILSDTAEDTDQTIEEVEEEVNDSMANEDTEEISNDEDFKEEDITRPSDFGFSKYYK